MNEPTDIRNKSRRVKNHILTRFLVLADKVDDGEILAGADKQTYNDLLMTFAKNVVPRSVEVGGDAENNTPIPILMQMNVPTDLSDNQDSEPKETD